MSDACGHFSQADPCLRHIPLPLLDIDLGTFPRATFVNGESEAIHQLLPRLNSDSWIMLLSSRLTLL